MQCLKPGCFGVVDPIRVWGSRKCVCKACAKLETLERERHRRATLNQARPKPRPSTPCKGYTPATRDRIAELLEKDDYDD